MSQTNAGFLFQVSDGSWNSCTRSRTDVEARRSSISTRLPTRLEHRIVRAAVFERTGPAREVMCIGDLPVPELSARDVLVRIHASGINPSDWKRRAGWRAAGALLRPVIPHTDGAGVVEATGAEVDPAWVGRRVWL